MIFTIYDIYIKPQPSPNKTQTKSTLTTTPLQKLPLGSDLHLANLQ